MFKVFLISLVWTTVAWGQTSRSTLSPYIENETLVIEGQIDSHIYDFISYEYKALKSVTKVRLNSFGGNHNWALEIAKKIQSYAWSTEMREGDVCASACIYLFGSGQKRVAHETSWFGVHGARVALGFIQSFAGECVRDGKILKSKGCMEREFNNYEISYEATNTAFDLIELSGVHPSLRDYYFNLSDDPKWLDHFNFLRKPDLVLSAQSALEFNLVTEIL